MKVLIKARSMSTSKGILRNGDIADLPETEVNKVLSVSPSNIEVLAEEVKEETPKKTTAKKKRARNKDGTLKADDPSTPENEAWEDA